MGRKKSYDEEDVLEKAMFLFWRKGHQAVSTRDLADEMGINQYSLYASFESKDVLFEKTLERYLSDVVEKVFIEPLLDPVDGLAAIRSYFEIFVAPGSGKFPTGCFICNTMAEEENPTAAVQKIIDRYQTKIADALASALRQAYPKAKNPIIQAKASLLLCVMLGIAVKKRNGFQGQPVQEIVEQIMDFVTIK
ncbi:MAG: TetR/AcrR family transcriptional regulator [Sneathiella sp.]|nr:TetR/AcrR family transcriptional regulator [Sneathiella sp.]